MAVFKVELIQGLAAFDKAVIADLEEYTRTLFAKTCDVVFDSTKPHSAERKAFDAEAKIFGVSLKEIEKIDDKGVRLAAFRAAASALALGFYHAGSGEVARGLRAALGAQGENAPKKEKPWRQHAYNLAAEACRQDAGLSNGKVATFVELNWKPEDYGEQPSHRSLEGFVAQQRNSGGLPQRSG